MESSSDSRQQWLNAWAMRHVQDRPGEPFPDDALEFWSCLDAWILDHSLWRVRCDRVSADPAELAERVRDKVLRYSHTFCNEAALTTWLDTICLNEFRTMLKTMRESASLDDEQKSIDKASAIQQMAPMRLRTGDAKILVAELFAKIPNRRNRDILWLSRAEGWSDTEIGERFGLPCATVHSIVQRTVRRLHVISQEKIGGSPGKRLIAKEGRGQGVPG